MNLQITHRCMLQDLMWFGFDASLQDTVGRHCDPMGMQSQDCKSSATGQMILSETYLVAGHVAHWKELLASLRTAG